MLKVMVWETGVQPQVVSNQGLWKWYLIPPCLTLSTIRYVSRVKWSNPGKGVAPSPTPWCSSYWKGSLQVANFTFTLCLNLEYKLRVVKFFNVSTRWTSEPDFFLIIRSQIPHKNNWTQNNEKLQPWELS